MYKKKFWAGKKKTEKVGGNSFNLFLPTGEKFDQLPNPFYILSIDPGTTNLGVRFEERTRIKKKVFTKLIFMEVLTIEFEEFCEVLPEIFNIFDSVKKWVMKCSLIIIEQQISTLNPKMTIFESALLTYFMIRLENSYLDPAIYEIHSQCAKRAFDIESGLSKDKVKRRIWETALEILEKAKDTESLEKLKEYLKEYQYHMTDCIVQIEAICQLENYPKVLSEDTKAKSVSR